MARLLKIRLSLKGRPIRTYTFDQRSISIGRDPGCDVFLDNTGISRSHAKIELTPGGFMVQDLGSANGTFLNDQQVEQDYVGHNDVIQIGKFALWLGFEQDRRARDLLPASATPGTYQGTTILSPAQLLELQSRSREEEADFVQSPAPSEGVPYTTCALLSGACFLAGTILGAALALAFHA